MIDSKGAMITPGCRVRQINVFDAGLGALLVNVGASGTVLSVGRARAEVQFDGRTAFDRFTQTNDPRPDRVHGRYLEVLPS